jgi:hypothetical protein
VLLACYSVAAETTIGYAGNNSLHYGCSGDKT